MCSSSEEEGVDEEEAQDESKVACGPDESSDDDVDCNDENLLVETNVASAEAEPICGSEASS